MTTTVTHSVLRGLRLADAPACLLASFVIRLPALLRHLGAEPPGSTSESHDRFILGLKVGRICKSRQIEAVSALKTSSSARPPQSQ